MHVAAGTRNDRVHVWRVSDGGLLYTWSHSDEVRSVAFSVDSAEIASAGEDNTIQIHELEQGSLLRSIQTPIDNETTISISPDGATLLSGSRSVIRLLNYSDGQLLELYDRETGGRAQFSPGDGLFGYGRRDSTVVVAENPFACDPCDANCDGLVDAFDIEPFLDLLFGPGVPCNNCTGDVNGDGLVNAFDIEPFLDLLFP